MRVRTLFLAVFLFILSVGLYAQQACSVLLIWDTQSASTPALVTALENAGLNVTLSDTSAPGYDGTNPSPTGFGCVILLDGTTYDVGMPASGQQALVSYVQNGGGFIGGEWLANDFQDGYYQDMRDLVLFDRETGSESDLTYTVVPGMESHPVLAGVPSSFTVYTAYNVGPAHTFATDPVTVLMTDNKGSDAVAVRQFGAGRVVGFNHAGNYDSLPVLADPNIQQLYINGVEWACAFHYDLNFQDDGNASSVCLGSKGGNFQWSVNGGSTYTGTLNVYNGGTMFWSQPGASQYVYVYYDPNGHTAWGYLYDYTTGVYSSLFDSNTLNDPATCGGGAG